MHTERGNYSHMHEIDYYFGFMSLKMRMEAELCMHNMWGAYVACMGKWMAAI